MTEIETIAKSAFQLNETERQKFWSKVKVDAQDQCWPWQGSLCSKGYGQISFWKGGKAMTFRAHRISFAFAVEREPGPVLDHLCRSRSCCNPKHLEEVTTKENVLRGVGLAAINAQRTHCENGHALDGDNLILKRSKGRPEFRLCKTCDNARREKWRSRRKLKVGEMKDVGDIVFCLTRQQREAILSSKYREEAGAWHPAGWYCAADKRVRYRLASAGLTQDYLRPVNKLTPRGQAVRDYLKGEK